ncbi:MAG: ABC transporter ATP-binding protein [Syntrophus sp. (in: bacteria)]
MSDIVIKAENLGKMYTIGHQAETRRYVALRDVLMQNALTIWNKTKDLAMGKPIIQGDTLEEFWALKDVSFEICRGEAVGIIGRNGAGKSTLLKVLSRITEPSKGRVIIKGRVASLLEVGTGFHPELSGRENIYLNGTIMGMTRMEIKRKFDEIVAFAEVEKYLDTPVKRYSSGMYVRLAFAVAAHLEPEILVVDEVLAVGDASFQKKCLGKMEDVAKEGRTVLFVSHNMGAIRQLCSRGICLESGSIQNVGDVDLVIDAYMRNFSSAQKREVLFEQVSNKPACILRAAVTCPRNLSEELFDINDQIEIRVEYILYERMSGVNLGIVVAREGIPVFTSYDIDIETHLFVSREAGQYRTRIKIPPHLLKTGTYTVLIGLGRSGIGVVDQKIDALVFDISDASEDTTHKGYAASRAGVLALSLPWNTELL